MLTPSPLPPSQLYITIQIMHTKIIASIGPKSFDPKILTELVESGMNIARFNFSHAKREEFLKAKNDLLKIGKKLKKEVKILQDLQGPRIRVGTILGDGLTLYDQKTYAFSHQLLTFDGKTIPISDPDLHLDIKKGDPFYLANGALELIVSKIKDGVIYCEVIKGGLLTSNKAINVPQTTLRAGGLTAKDIDDVKFGLQNGIDLVALSFVQTADDLEKLRKIIKTDTKIIAKIEREVALSNIDEIIQASDGIMVARGDLGIEIPLEKIPIIQKNLIRHSHWHQKPAIVATQMLNSMILHPRPTRAEVSDIANAVFDGADAVMLSDETAIGDYPVQSVSIMRKIVENTEKYINEKNFLNY